MIKYTTTWDLELIFGIDVLSRTTVYTTVAAFLYPLVAVDIVLVAILCECYKERRLASNISIHFWSFVCRGSEKVGLQRYLQTTVQIFGPILLKAGVCQTSKHLLNIFVVLDWNTCPNYSRQLTRKQSIYIVIESLERTKQLLWRKQKCTQKLRISSVLTIWLHFDIKMFIRQQKSGTVFDNYFFVVHLLKLFFILHFEKHWYIFVNKFMWLLHGPITSPTSFFSILSSSHHIPPILPLQRMLNVLNFGQVRSDQECS